MKQIVVTMASVCLMIALTQPVLAQRDVRPSTAATYGLSILPVVRDQLCTAGNTCYAASAEQSPSLQSGFRMNVSFTTMEPNTTANVYVFDKNGGLRGQTTVSSPAPMAWQVPLSRLVGTNGFDLGWVEFQVVSGKIARYSVVNDNIVYQIVGGNLSPAEMEAVNFALRAAGVTSLSSFSIFLDGQGRTAISFRGKDAQGLDVFGNSVRTAAGDFSVKYAVVARDANGIILVVDSNLRVDERNELNARLREAGVVRLSSLWFFLDENDELQISFRGRDSQGRNVFGNGPGGGGWEPDIY